MRWMCDRNLKITWMVSNNRLYVIEVPFYVQVAMFFN